ncbi:hypothetical protein OCL06_08780 [Alteromonas sp. ASW11-19]|uniref:Uncharacterized protein n=1 Tax=Alteromonas salexigens TaxID=2982530 RepID=A0ABT2VMZ6_9ALTE|nr:hypothetical protein [Alteromonas salexigens]MCU7554691.1 hypothetical protein [Alteromonas salexigens]
MVTKNERAEHGLRRLYINIAVIVVFALAMVSFIVYFNSAEPDVKARILAQYGKQVESSATNAHWKWQAEGRPEMIMLIHYDSQGKERDRRPVRMSHLGVPWVEASSQGCNKLWKMLLNVPMQVDGFRVIGEYYRGELVDNEPVNSRCRFRLSRGPYFDYHIYRGKVSLEGTQ